MNSVNLIGRIATDLKLETVSPKSGQTFKEFKKVDFILAVQNNKKDKDGKFLANFISITVDCSKSLDTFYFKITL
ncbi:hypothetical protein CWO85_01575 [Candidatus Phytoplasma ziziphi]|uniref:Single-stranded DNA-binding protein n=1 Tax=Ziziphus jujuba witches'-broom phytoplasma TaxID=135727 RepID=A0A660HMK1_ZIZJU|nr:hypothetical protein [Candidatus Phytoplasma ziziphi]AYJ01212.1 hypothetical protein CWO85_01575 [Candidatus Phytoplasma ziziphi]